MHVNVGDWDFDCLQFIYRERPFVKTSQRLSAAARWLHPPQGLIPMYDVARLITSPRPISLSERKPGRRTR